MLNLLFLERGSEPFMLTNYFHFFHLVFCFPPLLFCINPFLLTSSGQQPSGGRLPWRWQLLNNRQRCWSISVWQAAKSIPTSLIQSHSEISYDGSRDFLLHCLFLPNWAMAAGRHFYPSTHRDVITESLWLERKALLLLARLKSFNVNISLERQHTCS